MIKKEYKYFDITSKIIGCAMKVHSTLGNGFQEVIYQRCMAIEMEDDKLRIAREVEMQIYYIIKNTTLLPEPQTTKSRLIIKSHKSWFRQ